MTKSVVVDEPFADYRHAIDKDIASYAHRIRQTTKATYGSWAYMVTDSYLRLLERGGKRLRGSLVMIGYEMCGGTNASMIIQAARAMEMIHAYLLIIDDIQDNSHLRRGQNSVHIDLANYHKTHKLQGESDHFGVSLALNAALSAAHAAQMIMANLDVTEQYRLSALSILNRTMVVTSHGQTNDIFNQAQRKVSLSSIEQVMNQKTAQYTVLNPLHTGMVLAGAGCEDTDAITGYATELGIAFQIADDILGTFGDQKLLGKSPMSDMKEGKKTLLTHYALKQANHTDAEYLHRVLGKDSLTATEFNRIKEILKSTRAVDYSYKKFMHHITSAHKSLEACKKMWPIRYVELLNDTLNYLQNLVDKNTTI
jgi:geranylgeranyl pyrophosphate synthase